MENDYEKRIVKKLSALVINMKIYEKRTRFKYISYFLTNVLVYGFIGFQDFPFWKNAQINAKLAILIMKLIFLKIFLNGKQVYQKVYLLYTDSLNLVYVSLVRILKDEFL